MKSDPIPIISLFCGPGGLDVGFNRSGFDTVFAVDSDSDCVETFNRNRHRQIAHCVDLGTINGSELVEKIQATIGATVPRGVIGGPPCQAFSLSNVSGRRDPRKRLLLRYAEMIEILNEKYDLDFILFENVPGLKSTRHSRYFRQFRTLLEESGFRLWEGELNAKHYGVPQKRRRLFVIGINERLFGPIAFESPAHSKKSKTVRDVLSGLPEPAFFAPNLRVSKIPLHPNHWTMRPRSRKFARKTQSAGRSFRRLAWDEPSWAVAYGNREIHLHPESRRRISVYEAMLLQGFPKAYRLYGSLSAQVAQVSNAVPVPLAAAVARTIRNTLYEKPKRMQELISAWHHSHSRNFPWRTARTPYRVLIAEKLLQQTRAGDTVNLAYEVLIQKYPDIAALSNANKDDLETIFRPLGLPHRAEELVRMAKDLIVNHSANIPTTLEALVSLPGVGDYVARAVLCFGYGLPYPIVDANIGRVISRVFGIEKNYSNPARSPQLLRIAEKIIPNSTTDAFNYAFLDFCALVCSARIPQCQHCPLNRLCHYRNAGQARNRPTEHATR